MIREDAYVRKQRVKQKGLAEMELVCNKRGKRADDLSAASRIGRRWDEGENWGEVPAQMCVGRHWTVSWTAGHIEQFGNGGANAIMNVHTIS